MSTNSRRSVRDELLADLPRVTDAIVAAVRREIPAYQTLAPAQLREVEAIAAWGTARVLDAWVDDAVLREEDLNRFRGIGAARALDGRPLPVVLRAYRVAGACVTDLVAERATERLTVPDALALARLWMASIDALSEALYAGHTAASERIGADRDRALADLLDDLLDGRHATPAAIADRSRALDVRLPDRPVLLVVGPGTWEELPEQAWLRWVEQLRERLPDRDRGSLLARVRDGVGVTLLPRTPLSVVAEPTASRGWQAVALGEHVPADLPRGFRLARHALVHAPARALAGGRVLDDSDAAALAVAGGHRDADAATLHRLVLGPLAGRRVLLDSVQAYLTAGSAVAAADLVGCHPQTLRHRVRRIRDLTGRDLRRSWDRFVLELATLTRPAASEAGNTVGP